MYGGYGGTNFCAKFLHFFADFDVILVFPKIAAVKGILYLRT